MRGVWCQALCLSRQPVPGGGQPGPVAPVSRARLVWAWEPSTDPTACALASWRCALWGWREGVPGGVTGHQEFGRGRNKVMKWRVNYKGHAKEQWEPATSFVHHLTDEWVKYNKRHKVNVSFAEMKALSLTACIRHMSPPSPSTGSHDMHRAVLLCYSLLAGDMGLSIEDMHR